MGDVPRCRVQEGRRPGQGQRALGGWGQGRQEAKDRASGASKPYIMYRYPFKSTEALREWCAARSPRLTVPCSELDTTQR